MPLYNAFFVGDYCTIIVNSVECVSDDENHIEECAANVLKTEHNINPYNHRLEFDYAEEMY